LYEQITFERVLDGSYTCLPAFMGNMFAVSVRPSRKSVVGTIMNLAVLFTNSKCV
jgi:hypothetical protein